MFKQRYNGFNLVKETGQRILNAVIIKYLESLLNELSNNTHYDMGAQNCLKVHKRIYSIYGFPFSYALCINALHIYVYSTCSACANVQKSKTAMHIAVCKVRHCYCHLLSGSPAIDSTETSNETDDLDKRTDVSLRLHIYE